MARGWTDNGGARERCSMDAKSPKDAVSFGSPTPSVGYDEAVTITSGCTFSVWSRMPAASGERRRRAKRR
jgi:hypothetical protein